MEPSSRETLLTTEQAGLLLEIGAERVRQLCKQGYIERRGRNQVPLVAAVRGYIRFLKDDARRSSRSAAASAVQNARAEEIKLKIAERRGRLIDIVEHRDCFAEIIGTLKVGLDGVPAQVTTDGTLRARIESAIESVLHRAADRFEAATADLAAGGEIVATDSVDGAGRMGGEEQELSAEFRQAGSS